MLDAVLVLIFVCCPSLSTSPVPVLSLSSTNFASIVTLSLYVPRLMSNGAKSFTENPILCVV